MDKEEFLVGVEELRAFLMLAGAAAISISTNCIRFGDEKAGRAAFEREVDNLIKIIRVRKRS